MTYSRYYRQFLKPLSATLAFVMMGSLSVHASEEVSTLQFDDKKEIITCKIGKMLGNGGSKTAFEITLYYKTETDGIVEDKSHVAMHSTCIDGKPWENIVKNEVFVSDELQKLGIHTVASKAVTIKIGDESFRSYICPSFQSLTEKGLYVVDMKNYKSSTWVNDKNEPLYALSNQSNGDKDKPTGKEKEAWRKIFAPLAKNLYDMLEHGWGRIIGKIYDDSSNYVVKLDKNKGHGVYYFGFDFTDKGGDISEKYFYDIEKKRKLLHKKLDTLSERVLRYEYSFETKETQHSLNKYYTAIHRDVCAYFALKYYPVKADKAPYTGPIRPFVPFVDQLTATLESEEELSQVFSEEKESSNMTLAIGVSTVVVAQTMSHCIQKQKSD